MAREAPLQNESVQTPDLVLQSVRGQLNTALTRLQPPTGHGDNALPLVSYPVAKLTYPECINELDDLSQVNVTFVALV